MFFPPCATEHVYKYLGMDKCRPGPHHILRKVGKSRTLGRVSRMQDVQDTHMSALPIHKTYRAFRYYP